MKKFVFSLAVVIVATMAVPVYAVDFLCTNALNPPFQTVFMEAETTADRPSVTDNELLSPSGVPLKVRIPAGTRGVVFEDGLANNLVTVCWESGYAIQGGLLYFDQLILERNVNPASLKAFRATITPLE